MKVGITGAQGFIGSNLRMHLDDIGLPYTLMNGDNFESFLDKKITHVVHLAGRTTTKNLNLSDYLQDNVLLSSKVLDFSQKIGASVLLFSTYGYHTSQFTPPSAYYLSKALLEKVASYYAVQFKLNIQVLRLGSVFGFHQNQASLLSNVLRQIKGANKTICLENIAAFRSYVSVKDVTEFIVLSLNNKGGFQTHFVGDPNLISVKEFAESVMKIMRCSKTLESSTDRIFLESEISLSEAIKQNMLMGNQFSWAPQHTLFQSLSDILL